MCPGLQSSLLALLQVMLLACVKKKILIVHIEKQNNVVLAVARQAYFTAARHSEFIFLDICLHFVWFFPYIACLNTKGMDQDIPGFLFRYATSNHVSSLQNLVSFNQTPFSTTHIVKNLTE